MKETAEFNQVKPGDILSETTYYKADHKNVNQIEGVALVATTSKGQQVRIGDGIVNDSLYTADSYDKEEKLSKTALAELLTQTGGTVFTVNYQKQATNDDIQLAVSKTNNGNFASNKEIRSNVQEALNGQERTLRGYLLSVEPLMGRAKVVDLDVVFKTREADKIPGINDNTRLIDSGIRLVDLRHINWIIFKNVKYTLKK